MRTLFLFPVVTLVCVTLLAQVKSAKNPAGDWPTYNHDLAGTRYSPLTQITPSNVGKLKLAWGYRPSETGGRPSPQAVPLVVNGRMYLTAGLRIVALEPETGKEIWRYQVTGGNPSQRGVAYWPGDGNNPPRVIFTSGPRLLALNANTGVLDPGFGKEGVVDMGVAYQGVPTIFKNSVMVGAATGEYVPLGTAGNSRAFDARTGAKLWEFHSVAQPGETGHETWEGESWKNRSGTNMWGFQMTVDEQRGLAYMTFGSPTSTYFGGDRPGDNLFGNSVVAVDAVTGKYKWHFQAVHHDIWDFDLPPAPGLIDITRNGRKIPALALTGKLGLMFILNRETGKPIFGVEEREVPQSDVPGERTSRTQPFPVKPAPLARVSYKDADLVTAEDTTPEHAKACREVVERGGGLFNAGPYTPWLYRAEGAPPRSTIIFPGAVGGTNWGGTASDPKTGFVYAFTQNIGMVGWMQKLPAGMRDRITGEPYTMPFERASEAGPGPYQSFNVPVKGPDGKPVQAGSWPCQKPPWGQLTAVNANTGNIAWQVTVGVTDELPEGKKNTGRLGMAGPMVTAGGLVFLGSTNDNRFRAFDARTGRELWTMKLDYEAGANPISYQGKNGKQYVAIMSAGTPTLGVSGTVPALLVYALP